MPGNGFCPKCGAVLYNGMCQSCGYGGRFSGKSVSNGKLMETAAGSNVSGRGNSGKDSRKIWLLIILVILIGIAVPVILVAVLFSGVTHKVVDGLISVTPEPDYAYGDDSWIDRWDDGDFEAEAPAEDYGSYGNGYFGDGYAAYVPSPEDEYYESFVSATVRGLSYDIAWNDSYLYADDEEITACFGAYYPVLIGADVPFAESINERIRNEAFSYQPEELQGEDYLYVECYVTYMSEEILSVLFDVWGYQDHKDIYRLEALNFDMSTGELITAEQMLPDSLWMGNYRERCEYQNGYEAAEVLAGMSDEAILEAITDAENGVIFYSPVGVDAGFNYDGGWMTVTLKMRTY